MVTIEQKSALTDLVGNIVSPILLWLNKFVDAKTQKERRQILNMLSEISKDAVRKVESFECKTHCFPIFRNRCIENETIITQAGGFLEPPQHKPQDILDKREKEK